MLKQLGITNIGSHTLEALNPELAAQLATKEARVKRKRKRLAEEEDNDPDYSPGCF